MTTSTPSPVQDRVRLTVPWLTVLPLAAVMAYADGFWMLTLRGAVGAIERTQEPFVSWLRESTLILPLFVLAVLGALTLAMRRFGPVLPTRRTVAATGLLVAAAGTVLGVAVIVGSSAYDYHLESDLLGMMDTMRSTCAGDCLALQQQSTFAAIVRAVLYTGAFVLVTNLILVGWVVAMFGGRLAVTSTGQLPADTVEGVDNAAQTHVRADAHAHAHADAHGSAHDHDPGTPDSETGSRLRDLRLLLIAGLLGSAAIHSAVASQHLSEWPAAGLFFILLTAAELATVIGLLLAPRRREVLIAAAVVSAGPLLLWLYSRTVGLPFGPTAGTPEAFGIPDMICCALEIFTLVIAIGILKRGSRLARRPAGTAHTRWLGLVAIIAAAAIGIAGTTPAWFDGSDGPPEATMTH